MITAGDERGVKRLLHDAKSGENGTEPLRFGNSNRLCVSAATFALLRIEDGGGFL